MPAVEGRRGSPKQAPEWSQSNQEPCNRRKWIPATVEIYPAIWIEGFLFIYSLLLHPSFSSEEFKVLYVVVLLPILSPQHPCEVG